MYAKCFFVILSFVFSLPVFAGTLVMMPYQTQEELEHLFQREDIVIHFYSDRKVIATAVSYDASEMVFLDASTFDNTDVYYLVYCPSEEQRTYLQRESENGRCLYRNEDFLVMKPGRSLLYPHKNDGMVAIFNKKATLPRALRDFPNVTEEDPAVRQMLDQVNMDSIAATVSYLQSLENRKYNSSGAYAAQEWIQAKFEKMGLEVELQPFVYWWENSSPNVIAIQRGTLYPDIYVVCGSHYDSFSYYGSCPGADDNATGVASVLETARIMTQHEFEYSIVYCTFSAEEMGLIGSEAYASRCQSEGMDIIGYFNNDMNGYLHGNIHIDCVYPDAVEPIGAYYRTVGTVYFPEMPIRHVDFTQGDSDHTSFNNHGYMGIYPFEDLDHHSPYIHTAGDTIGTSVTSWEMSQRYCQMNLACLAEIANMTSAPAVYCNPPLSFEVEYSLPSVKDSLCGVYLSWMSPSEGSTGNVENFAVYRDGVLATQLPCVADTLYYRYDDLVLVGDSAFYHVVAIYDDGCEASTDTLLIVGVEKPDGVPSGQESSVVVYPNPSGQFVIIDGEDVCGCRFFDMSGREIDVPCQGNRFDVRELETGVYVLVVESLDGNVFVRKVVVN